MGCSAALPQRRLLRGGVRCGRARRDPYTPRCSVGRRSVGVPPSTARLEDLSGRCSSPSVELRNLAAGSERAARGRAAQRLSAARSGFSAPAKSFVCKGTVRLCRRGFPPPPPASAPSANSPCSPLWMGNHRLQLPRRPEAAAPFLCLSPLPAAAWPLPSNSQDPGPCPPAGGHAALHRSFPFGPKLCPGFFVLFFVCSFLIDLLSHAAQQKCESCTLAFLQDSGSRGTWQISQLLPPFDTPPTRPAGHLECR